ncbi:DUF4468 domain-containing protein [Ornithobacterium rhinotracheale]|uniref:DUF4468 domain-containing protein n=1 Tax=Ornithobacterium rhinotracheale TaxID=28251 RepID=UPI001FF3C90C|nr:DUF4468 domain-containing protein [Ornithobacterium rhinotracheale]MCK0199126.1 DUF4468 domain-containing protein [Ornithobacterium rhinotracheale]
MKKVLLLLFLCLFAMTKAQEAKPLGFTKVVEVPGVSKENLYNRAKLWVSDNFKKAEYVVDVDDKENGLIICKSNYLFESKSITGGDTARGRVTFTLKMFFKDGKYKYEITDFVHSNKDFGLLTESDEPARKKSFGKGWYQKIWKEIKTDAKIKIAIITTDLEKGMKKQSEIEKDNW